LNARDRQLLELRRLGLSEPQIAKAMGPFAMVLAQYRMVPVKVIEPPQNLYDTLEFNSQLIEEAMAMGRTYVADHWAELEQFLGV
jgi:hypothetical protein